MKKIFFFAAAAIAALTVNAAAIDFATVAAQGDYEVEGLTVNSTETKDTKVVYDLPANTAAKVTFKNLPVKITKTAEKDAKTKYFTVNLETYVEMGGKGFELEVSGVKSGSDVKLLVANKSDKGDGSLAPVSGLDGAAVTLPMRNKGKADTGNYDKDGYCWVTATFKATAGKFVITETAYGFRVKTIDFEVSQGLEGVQANEVKAVKRMVNGQVVIEREGRLFNLLGAEVK